MKKYKVAIVEDYKLLAQAISGIVNSFEHFEVIFTCENGKIFTETISEKNLPDVILMDINMPIMNGIETTKWLKENFPNVHVLALSVEDDEKTILEMIKSGAGGYLPKDVDKNILENALLTILETRIYYTKLVNEAILHSLNKEKEQLKDTEITFLKLICTELTYKEIADKMHLSPKTIDGYRDQLFVKLNVKNRIGLVLFAIKNKIYIP